MSIGRAISQLIIVELIIEHWTENKDLFQLKDIIKGKKKNNALQRSNEQCKTKPQYHLQEVNHAKAPVEA